MKMFLLRQSQSCIPRSWRFATALSPCHQRFNILNDANAAAAAAARPLSSIPSQSQDSASWMKQSSFQLSWAEYKPKPTDMMRGSHAFAGQHSYNWISNFVQLRHHSSFSGHGRDIDVGRGDGRNRGGGQHLNKHGHDCTQIGGPIDTTICKIPETEIHNLLRDRLQCKRVRDYQKADSIQKELMQFGVSVDSRRKAWRADGKCVSTPTNAEGTTQFLKMSDCQRADNIQKELTQLGVIDNKAKAWRADGKWVSTSTNAKGTTQIPRMPDCQTIEEATTATYDNLDKASPSNLSAFWAVLPRLLKYQQSGKQQPLVPQLNAIFNKTMDNVERFGPRHVTQTGLAFAKIIKSLGRNKRSHVRGSHHEFLFDVLHGRRDIIFQFIANTSMPILPKFDARGLSNLAYAYALVEYVPKFDDGSTLFYHLAEKSIPLLGKFNPQDLSNIIWAFARAEFSHPRLFGKVADHIVSLDRLGAFKPQELSNIVWAFAKADSSHPGMFGKVADHIVGLDHLGAFDPQALSNIVGAFAKADSSHPRLFGKVAENITALDQLGAFKPQELSIMVWSFAKADSSHPRMFGKVADHIVGLDNLEDFGQQEISNMVWAFAKADVHNPQLFDKLTDAAIDKQDKFGSEDISNLLRWTK